MLRMTVIDPWGTAKVDNYSKLFDEFGISRFDELLGKIKNPNRYMRRRIIFGHRDYDSVLNAMLSGKPFAALSGFMPSGKVHLGHKMVMDEIIWHQQQGGDVFLAIADMEAHAVRGISWEKCYEIGINEYILSAIALGFEPGGHIYFQSDSSHVRQLAFELGIKANLSEVSAIYGFNGETSISHMMSTLIQSADILHPQLQKFSGPKPVVIPVGTDQDPHIRLTRGLAYKMNMFLIEERNDSGKTFISVRGKTAPKSALFEVAEQTGGKLYEAHVDVFDLNLEEVSNIVRGIELKHHGYAFMPPASTYHKFMTGLQGGKMSSSVPESFIALTEKPEEGAKKVMRAKTGGRVTLEEQKRYGGEPDKCGVYELMLFHLIEDDNELLEIYKDCIGGKRSCGKCKKYAAELMQEFLREHQERRELARDKLKEFNF